MFRSDNADKVGRKRARAKQAARVLEAIHVLDAYTNNSYVEEGPGGRGVRWLWSVVWRPPSPEYILPPAGATPNQ